MKISIITATYNSGQTVLDTLQSLANQDYGQVEHIIVDGLSKDNTLDIVRQFPHVAKLLSEKDKGIYDAMNKGIALAEGEIIGILNSDDFYVDSQVLGDVADCFRDPAVDAVYGNLQYVHPEHTDRVIRNWRSGPYHPRKFLYGWMPPHPTFFVRRRLYEQYGSFDTSLRSAADYELMLRFLFRHRAHAVYLDRLLVRMRAGGASNVSLGHRWRANREDRMAWRMNNLKPYFFTIPIKPIRKISQFLIK